MGNIVLLNGVFNYKKISEPLGCAVLAAILRQRGYDQVEIYEPGIEGESVEQVVSKLSLKKPSYIAISVVNFNNKDVLKFVELYKKVDKDVRIVIGGHGPSIKPELFLKDGVDVVFIGEGENNFPKYFDRVFANESYEDIEGIAYFSGGEMKINPPGERVEDLDEIPLMARDVLGQLVEKYGNNILCQMLGSRGCYRNCSYCSVKAFTRLQKGKVYRQRSVQSVVDEIKQIHDKYKIERFVFEDDNFMPPNLQMAKEKVDLFYKLIKENKLDHLTYYMQFRPDNVDAELVGKLKEIGLHGIFIGVESINEDEIGLYGRQGKLDQVYTAIEELNKIGFTGDINSQHRLKIGYIMFNPYSTRENLLNSMRFIKKINVTPKKLLTRLFTYYATPVTERLLQDGLLNEDLSYNFHDKDMEIIFNTATDTLSYIFKSRERVRFVKKVERELKAFECPDSINDLRLRLDEMCYEAFEEIVLADVEKMASIKEKYCKKVDELMEDADVVSEIVATEKKLMVESGAVQLFR